MDEPRGLQTHGDGDITDTTVRALRERASRTVAIVGTDSRGRAAFCAHGREARVVAFVDDHAGDSATTLLGVPVVPAARLPALEAQSIVVASRDAAPVLDRLRKLGIADDRVVVFSADDTRGAYRALRAALEQRSGTVAALLGRHVPLPALALVIFGAGAGGREAFARCVRRHRIVGFADNDPAKIGTTLLDRPVLSLDALARASWDRIVVGSVHFEAIREQLVRLGIPRHQICTADDVLVLEADQ